MKEWKSISEITAYLVILLKQTLIDTCYLEPIYRSERQFSRAYWIFILN